MTKQYSQLMPEVAKKLLGAPSSRSGSDLRYGRKGSLSVCLDKGTWYDHEADKGGGVIDLIQREHRCNKPAAINWLNQEGLHLENRAPIFYDYRDAQGEVAYRVERREGQFRQYGPNGKGGFVCRKGCMNGAERLPYRLPELLASDPADLVFICEGEKDADRLASAGLIATCNSGGAGKFEASFAPHFEGRRVVLLEDNDRAGRDHVRDVREKLGSKPAEIAILALPDLPEKGDVSDWLNRGGTIEQLRELAEQALAQPDDGEGAAHKGAFTFQAVGSLNYRKPEFLIDSLMETSVLALIFGDPGCGKSFAAIDMALCVATGTPFHGHDVKQGPVFYIAGEGFNGLARRFAAWSKHRSVDIEDAPLFVSNRPAQFLDSGSAEQVSEAVAALAEQHGNPALIVIDTLARNFGPGDENSTSEMGQFVAAIDDLKAQFRGCAVLIVHHTGHNEKKRARGSMALKAALDCEYCLSKNESIVKLSNTKMKDADPPNVQTFKLVSVGLDDGGSSAVLELTEDTASDRSKPLTASQKLAKESYIEAAIKSGIWNDEGFAGLHLDDWRPAFYASHTGDNPDTKKKAFNRSRSSLLGDGLVAVRDDVYLWKDKDVTFAISIRRDTGQGRDNSGTCPDAEAE